MKVCLMACFNFLAVCQLNRMALWTIAIQVKFAKEDVTGVINRKNIPRSGGGGKGKSEQQ